MIFQIQNNILIEILLILFLLLPLLLGVAYLTVFERKALARMQRRVGPETVGPEGVLQAFADALKVSLKEQIIPSHSNKIIFYIAPISTLIFSLLNWIVVPLYPGLAILDFSLAILVILALSSLGVIGVLFTNVNSEIILQIQKNNKDKIKIQCESFKNFNQKRFYSINNIASISNNLSFEEFCHWFSGFFDAESCFYISKNKNGFTFNFKISLHIDDLKVIEYIHQKLGIGNIYTYEKIAIFKISKKEDLYKLFKIFKIKPLNTTKYLNYLAFKESFLLYLKNKNLSLTEKAILFNKINEIKNSMNTLRIDFVLPDNHQILITPYWLLGFIEGDGSFSVSTLNSFPLRFNIVQAITEKKVLEAIKTFLLKLSGNYKIKKINDNPVQILEQKDKNLKKGRKLLLNLNINSHSFLIDLLVPFFDKLNFISKKELDYKDWKNILKLKSSGWHLSKEGANLIMALASYMNNNRLSSNIKILNSNSENFLNYNLLNEKIKIILNKPSNFEILPDGKIFIKSEQKFWKGRGNVKIEVYDKKGLLLYSFENLEMAAKYFNVDKHIIKYRLNSEKPFLIEEKEIYFKRFLELSSNF